MLPHVQSISLLNYWVALSYSKHLSHKWNSTSFENQQLDFHSLNLSHPTFLDTHESKYICTKDHQVMFPWHKQESVNSIGNGSQHRANGKKVHSATKVRENPSVSTFAMWPVIRFAFVIFPTSITWGILKGKQHSSQVAVVPQRRFLVTRAKEHLSKL